MNLGKFYTIDECNNFDEFYYELDLLRSESKLNYIEVEYQIFKIDDLDLTDVDIEHLLNRFDELEVYETEYFDGDEEDFEDFDVEDDW